MPAATCVRTCCSKRFSKIGPTQARKAGGVGNAARPCAGTTVGRMALTPSGPLPPGDRKHFSDPAADPVYAAIKSLDSASQHQIFELLRTKLVAEDVATYGTEKTRVGYAADRA